MDGIDLDGIVYIKYLLGKLHFRHTPTHRGSSLAEPAKSSATVLREWVAGHVLDMYNV